MKVHKLEGIKVLRLFQLPTVQLLDISELMHSKKKIDMDLSIRLSPKHGRLSERNVFLPSIHNVRNKKEIWAFYKKYFMDYDVFAHKSVEPELIGTGSRYESFISSYLFMDTYKDWGKRAKQIIHNSMSIPVYGNRFILSASQMQHEDYNDRKDFMKVYQQLRKLPFENYNVEYAFENGKLVFSELTIDK